MNMDAHTTRRFREAWADPDMARDLGTKLNCGEEEALADLLAAFGDQAAAERWRAEHAEGDDGGDDHCLTGPDPWNGGPAQPVPPDPPAHVRELGRELATAINMDVPLSDTTCPTLATVTDDGLVVELADGLRYRLAITAE